MRFFGIGIVFLFLCLLVFATRAMSALAARLDPLARQYAENQFVFSRSTHANGRHHRSRDHASVAPAGSPGPHISNCQSDSLTHD